MTVLPIRMIGDGVLRSVTSTVSLEELATDAVQTLIDDMIDTMRHAQGAGIAATQVGSSLNICVIGVEDNRRYPYKPAIPLSVLVNPEMTVFDEETYPNNEGCLSVPLRGDLPRFMNIEVTSLDRAGTESVTIYRGLTAGTVQHEVDHLAGVLIVDRIDTRTMTTWEHFERNELAGFVERIQFAIDRTEPRISE